MLGAVFNLNDPAHVVHWHFFEMSVSNLVVICLMLVVFALAILLPFPGATRRQAARTLHDEGGAMAGGTLKGKPHRGGQAGEGAMQR
jgi:hypothetical protein